MDKKEFDVLSGFDLSDDKRNRRKKHIRSAVAIAASAGILVSGIFRSPADLIHGNADGTDRITAPYAIEMQLQPSLDDDDDGTADDEDDGEDEEGKKRTGIRAGIRAMILRLPVAVRAIVFVPLWCIGWVVTGAFTSLWGTVLSPVMSTILGWLAVAGVIMLCTLGIAKTAFPNLPIKKIVNRKSFLAIILGVAACSAFDAFAPHFIENYSEVKDMLRFIGASLVLAAAAFPFAVSSGRSDRHEKAVT